MVEAVDAGEGLGEHSRRESWVNLGGHGHELVVAIAATGQDARKVEVVVCFTATKTVATLVATASVSASTGPIDRRAGSLARRSAARSTEPARPERGSTACSRANVSARRTTVISRPALR